MPLPTLVKTWQFNCNQLMAAQATNALNAQNVVWNYKNTLVTFPQNPWQVVRSSNGAVVSNSDLWTAPGSLAYTTTAPSGPDGAGNARSWIVLKNPNIGGVNGFQILFDMILQNGESWFGSFYSPGAGFTGGTTTQRPNATDIRAGQTNINFGDKSSNGWAYTNCGIGTQGLINYRLNGMMSTDGKCTRLHMVRDAAGTTTNQMFMVIDELLNVPAGVEDTAYVRLASNASNVLAYNNLFTNFIDGAAIDFNIGGNPTRGNFTKEVAADLQTFANEISNEWPMWPLAGVIDGAVDLGSTNRDVITPGPYGRVGDFADLWLGSSGVASLDTYPGDGSNQFAQFGLIILPWDGSVPLKA